MHWPTRTAFLFYFYSSCTVLGALWLFLLWTHAFLKVNYWVSHSKHQAMDAVFYDGWAWLVFFATLVSLYQFLYKYEEYKKEKESHSVSKMV